MILLQRFRVYLRQILDPSDEQEREEDTVEAIRKGIVFRGTNLWVLIFCHVYCVFGIEHEFDGRDYRSHVNFSADGADYGDRSGSWNQ